ncbi:hypothetical protein ACEPAF_1764 [Sanghuangporus sanghuang]
MMIERVSRTTQPEAATKGETGARAIAQQPVVCNIADQEGVPTRVHFKRIKSGIESNKALKTANVVDNNATKVVARGVAGEVSAGREWEEGRRPNPTNTIQARFKTERASVIISFRQKPLSDNESASVPEGLNEQDRVGNKPEKGCRTQRRGMAIDVEEPEYPVLLSQRKRETTTRPQRLNDSLQVSEDKKLNAVCRAENADKKTRRKGKAMWPPASKNASTGSKRHRDESRGDIDLLATNSTSCRRVRQKSDIPSKSNSYDTGKQTQANKAHRAVGERRGPVVPRDGSRTAEASRIRVGDLKHVASIPMDIRCSTRLAHGTEPLFFVQEIVTGGTTRPRALPPSSRVKDPFRTKPTMEKNSIETFSRDALDLDSADFVRIGDLSSPPVSGLRHTSTRHWHLRIGSDAASKAGEMHC